MKTKITQLETQVNELLTKYTLLQFSGSKHPKVYGRILAQADRGDKSAICDYDVEIHIPSGYPCELPKAYEVGGKIDKDYHQFEDGELCLGAPDALQITFLQNRTLLGFVENLLIPYLFDHTCYMKTGVMPIGDFKLGK